MGTSLLEPSSLYTSLINLLTAGDIGVIVIHMTTTTAPATFSNERAESIFANSGISETFREVIRWEASFLMNVTGMRYSDCVLTACNFFPEVSGEAAKRALAALQIQGVMDAVREVLGK